MAETTRNSARASGLWALVAVIAMVGWVAWRNVAEDQDASRAPYQSIHAARSQEEQALLAALLGEAYGVLRSPAFRDNLLALGERYPTIYAKPTRQDADVVAVARVVGLEQAGARYAPASVRIVGEEDRRDPMREHASAGEGAGMGRYSDMVFGRAILEQFRSGDLVGRSCAINVAAHEYAHTITTTPIGFSNAFTDTTMRERRIANRRHPGTPVASYLIGAVAQCTWLQQQGRIARQEVAACVEVFGVGIFNWARCPAFARGEPVVIRPGLPAAATPL